MKSEVQPPAAAPQETKADGIAMVRWLMKHQEWLQKIIEDYPQGGYQRDLDTVEALLELVESTPETITLSARDQGLLVEAILDPPEPNEALRKAFSAVQPAAAAPPIDLLVKQLRAWFDAMVLSVPTMPGMESLAARGTSLVAERKALLGCAIEEIQHLRAEVTRAVLRYTLKGYTAGENADSKHWRERAEVAETEVARLRALQGTEK